MKPLFAYVKESFDRGFTFVLSSKDATALLGVLMDVENEDKPAHEFMEIMRRVKRDMLLHDIIRRFDGAAGVNGVIYKQMEINGVEAGMIATLIDFIERDRQARDGHEMPRLLRLRKELK